MCNVSNIGNGFQQNWPYQPNIAPAITGILQGNQPTRAEFNELKKAVEELKTLLLAAKKYDEETGQPDCEQEEKVAFIKKIADAVGVNLEEIFGEDKK